MTVHVLSRWADPQGMPAFDLTSHRPSLDTTRPFPAISPFHLGPVQLYGGKESRNMENAWQYAKVYPEYDTGSGPADTYYPWASEGWAQERAVRYPMGKGAIPKYSLWAGDQLDYIHARKRIYIPLYSHAVRWQRMHMYRWLVNQHIEHGDIAFLDFDAYDHRSLGYSWDDVINDPGRKMGHAFVLAMMIEGVL